MSHRQSQTSTGDQSPLLLDNMLSSQLRLECKAQRSSSSSSTELTVPGQPVQTPVILSTQSEAARKLGSQQLIPKNLAVTSRPKNRHHTTVVTLPVAREAQTSIQRFSHNPDLSWEDYDGDDNGLRRNRRNKSYRAAVTSLDADLTWKQDLLQPVSEEKETSPSPKPVRSPGRNRTLGRKRNEKHGGSFKDDPRLYQEIKERGLQLNSLGPDDDDSAQMPEEDQGIVVKNYKAAYVTWSQLPQVAEMGILERISPEERKRQETICQKTPKQTTPYYAARWALKAISRLVKSCNDGARRMERTEQMYTIQKQMDFGKIKPFPLVSSSRWLLKRGELAVCTEDLGLFWKAFSHKSYYLFLFNDVLIVTKKKRQVFTSLFTIHYSPPEESYVVFDYATLENVDVEEVQADKLYLRLEVKPNSEGRCEQMALVAYSKLDRARWVTALRWFKQGESSPNKNALPQYEATKAYMAKEPDELSLQQAEVVIVLQEVDGWCCGERLRDGERGWFPASCATQITSRTAIEENIERMQRLRKETNV
ncbi:Rho guanine nucleotide exchange factor 16 [Bagarius yarrelli]|uniref:Rho guanine nucleotide exchange factor 16 n=1 Tax=Bagarius yarrelli TaxID=175774 RepID=A0A556U219_BAGYA|nr:Rho guanine nucleotide exchange factor 16 [Bagarius yarrelli]